MDIVAELRNLLGESGGPVFWTDSHLYDALNQAQLDVWARLKPSSYTTTLPLNSEQSIVAIPVEIYIPFSITYQGKQCLITSHAELERYDRGWRGEALSSPVWFAVWDSTHVRAFPRPAEATDDYQISGVAYPPELSPTSPTLTSPIPVQKAVLYRAASALLESTQPSLAQLFDREGDGWEARHKRTQRNSQPHNLQRLAPSSRLAQAMGGTITIGKSLPTSPTPTL